MMPSYGMMPQMGMGNLLGLTQPQFMPQYMPQGMMSYGAMGGGFGAGGQGLLRQMYDSPLGDLAGKGFGALFGDSSGRVNFGGGNLFQPGKGFYQELGGGNAVGPVFQGSGMDFGSFFGSLFG